MKIKHSPLSIDNFNDMMYYSRISSTSNYISLGVSGHDVILGSLYHYLGVF